MQPPSKELIEIFQKRDGALPDIELNNLTSSELISVYAFLRGCAKRISSAGAYYWCLKTESEVSIRINDNPATLVASSEAEPFHLCFDGITSPSGCKVPELGIFVFQDSLVIDYQMGASWTESALIGLFEIIDRIKVIAPKMDLKHRGNIFDNDGGLLESYWQKICKV